MIVDVHGHITPPEMLERFPMPASLADVSGMLDRKSEAGIDLTIVGTPVGRGTMMRIPGYDNYAQSRDDIRAHHDWIAETVAEHAPRLAAYAYTNPFGGEALLADAADLICDVDGFVGLIVNSSVKGQYLDAPEAQDFWAMAAEVDVPVMLHAPAEPVGSEAMGDFRLVEQLGRFCDITLGVAAIVWSGVLERHPRLKVIASTAGGALGLLGERFDVAHQPRHWKGDGPPPPWAAAPPISQPPSVLLRQVYVDTATPNRFNHMANLEVFGADHILFGTDSPPLMAPVDQVLAGIRSLPIEQDAIDRVLGGNAASLFGLGPDRP